MKHLLYFFLFSILILNLINCSQKNIWENANDAVIEPAISVSDIEGNTTENGTQQASFKVKLTIKPADDVTISLGSDDESEGIVEESCNSLTFTPENWYIEQTVYVTGQDDSFKDGNVTYNIILTSISLDIEYNNLSVNSGEIINIDDETAGITVSSVRGDTGEDGSKAQFDIVLNTQPRGDVTVNFYSSDTGEGNTDVSALTFNNLTWSIPQTVTITGVNDNIDDGDITYQIIFDKTTGDDSDYNDIMPAPVSVVNIDNDTAGFIISPITGYTTESGDSTIFTIKLMTEPVAEVSIGLSSEDESEVILSPASLVFNQTNWNTDQPVTLTGVDDYETDGNQTCSINFSEADSSDPKYDVLTPAALTVINQDNDSKGITISPVSRNTTEAGGTATFSVVLNSAPTADVTISFQSDDTGEGTVSPSSCSFPVLLYDNPQIVTVTGVDDFIDDDNITYNITFVVDSADTDYDAMPLDPLPVINEDDDTAGINFSMHPVHRETTEDGGTFVFSARLTSEPVDDVTVNFATSDATEGQSDMTSLTFTDTTWNQLRTVTVTGQDDDINDGNIPYSIAFSTLESADEKYNIIQPANINLVNIDNDTGWTECGKPGFSGGSADYVSLYVYNNNGILIPFIAFADAAAKGAVTVMYMIRDEWIVLGERGFNGQNSGYISLHVVLEKEKIVPYVSFIESENGGVTVARNSGIWEYIKSEGADNSRKINQGTATCTSMDIFKDSSGNIIPYVAFCESNNLTRINKVSVMYYSSGYWGYAGNSNFSDGDSSDVSLKVYNTGEKAVPFVAYCDKFHSSKAVVQAQYGSVWTDIGENGEVSSGRARNISLGLYQEIPYVAFISNDASERATVMFYQDKKWDYVGGGPVYTGQTAYTSLFIFDNGGLPMPFIVFCDKANDSKASVYNYSDSWMAVGDKGFSAGSASYLSIFVSSNADGSWIPSVGYSDRVNNNAATVMTYK